MICFRDCHFGPQFNQVFFFDLSLQFELLIEKLKEGVFYDPFKNVNSDQPVCSFARKKNKIV